MTMAMHERGLKTEGMGRGVAGVLVGWGVSVAVLAQSGAYGLVPRPSIALFVAAGIVIPTVAYFRWARLRVYLEQVGLRTLTALHVWRIPAALLFFWYGSQGLLPDTFVRHAAWGDLLAGVLALYLTFSRERRWKYVAFHTIGLADFILAVGTGLTFTLLDDPRMAPIVSLPLALIPLYGVGISGASHLMAFDMLRRGVGLGRGAGDAGSPVGKAVAGQ